MSKKISDLTAASTPLAGTELVEIVQGGTSKKVEASYLGGAAAVRERLSSARTYYVRSDGSDSNNGLANTSGGAFLTIQKAVNVVSSSLDIAAGVTVTIQVADGTYTGAVDLPIYVGAGAISIVGNTTTPENCIVSVTNANCFSCNSKTAYSVSGFKLQTTTAGAGLNASNGGTINFASCDFGACVDQHIRVSAGAFITAKGNYSISGGSSGHWYAITGGVITTNNRTVTLTGTPGFSVAFVWMDRGLGMVDCYGITFTGSATGKRYIVNNNSVCFVNGASTTYLPGSIAGTTATGGQYA